MTPGARFFAVVIDSVVPSQVGVRPVIVSPVLLCAAVTVAVFTVTPAGKLGVSVREYTRSVVVEGLVTDSV